MVICSKDTMSRNILDDPQSKKQLWLGEVELDELFEDAVKLVVNFEKASASLIQRRLGIGYARAAKLIDQLEQTGAIGPAEGSAPRTVLISSIDELNSDIAYEDNNDEPSEASYDNYIPPGLGVIKKTKDTNWKKSIYDAINDRAFKNSGKFSIPIGFTDDDNLQMTTLSELNHLIIGGNSVSQKEIALDTILVSLLLKESPADLKMILVDPTRYLSLYDGLPHLLAPVIYDPEKLISALRWLCHETDRRLKVFSETKVRDIAGYSEASGNKSSLEILLVMNQVEGLFAYSPADIEAMLSQILMSAQRVGIHIIFTANLLTADIVPNSIQSEIPNKMLFKFTSSYDTGRIRNAEVQALKPGEIIFVTDNRSQKLSAVFTDENNVKAVSQSVRDFGIAPTYN